jgi:hypothetical protein
LAYSFAYNVDEAKDAFDADCGANIEMAGREDGNIGSVPPSERRVFS